MKKYFFMKPVLRFIDEGTLFNRIFASGLRVFAVLASIGALVAWMRIWKSVFEMSGATAVLGGIVFQLLFVVVVYMVTHTVMIRATDIDAIDKSDFTIIRIVSIFLRMLGEIYACISVAAGAGGGILLFFGGYTDMTYRATHAVPGMGWQNSLLFSLFDGVGSSVFVSSILVMLGGVIGAIFWLAFFYLASEMVVVLVDIARNTRAVRDVAERFEESGNTP